MIPCRCAPEFLSTVCKINQRLLIREFYNMGTKVYYQVSKISKIFKEFISNNLL